MNEPRPSYELDAIKLVPPELFGLAAETGELVRMSIPLIQSFSLDVA